MALDLIAALAFLGIFRMALLGIRLRKILPGRHFTKDLLLTASGLMMLALLATAKKLLAPICQETTALCSLASYEATRYLA
jgi:hypothetical protein